ncbi:hypothetical protein DPM13_00650 [Paracoccus mutanolyticus]|uniref:Uncharacterized protein n=1 Tax=Paracoccus mutanolyticus TaxID=1499308 RepID=A0ABN5M409_9RHOB|nr:hypothetical protein DPM13_00650 [Paracoccus mutanolyticus]
MTEPNRSTSFGDAWVEPYSQDGRGTNVVVGPRPPRRGWSWWSRTPPMGTDDGDDHRQRRDAPRRPEQGFKQEGTKGIFVGLLPCRSMSALSLRLPVLRQPGQREAGDVRLPVSSIARWRFR